MLTLAILVCSLSAPADCSEHHLYAPDRMTPYQCLMAAQPQMARWATEHPSLMRGRRIVRWRCVRAGRVAFPEMGRAV